MGDQSTDWEGACTLEEYIISLFEKRLTKSDEFKVMLRIYGREKLESIWQKHLSNKQKQGKKEQPQ